MKNGIVGLNQDNVQLSNRALLLNIIQREGVCSRAHLAKLSKLKQATVTYIMNDFLKWNLVEEVGLILGEKGRRSIGVSINKEHYGVISVRITRHDFSVAVYDMAGNCVISKQIVNSPEDTPRTVFDHIKAEIENLIEQENGRKILSIGMAVPGPFNIRKKKIALMTGTKGWEQISIKEELEQTFQRPVFLEHDAHAGALAQLWNGEDRGDYDNGTLLYVSVGQGVGAGILVNGEILEGSIGFAGEIGHMTILYNGEKCECGNRGCMEKYSSRSALKRRVNEELKTDYSFSEIADKVRQGDSLCRKIYEECCEYLGLGLVNTINCFNPDWIILGDDMANLLPEVMLEKVKAVVEKRILAEMYADMSISISTIKEDVELCGAAIVAMRDIYQNTSYYFE